MKRLDRSRELDGRWCTSTKPMLGQPGALHRRDSLTSGEPSFEDGRLSPRTWCHSGQAVNGSGHHVILASLEIQAPDRRRGHLPDPRERDPPRRDDSSEQDDEWQDGRRYFRPQTMALIDAQVHDKEASQALLMAS